MNKYFNRIGKIIIIHFYYIKKNIINNIFKTDNKKNINKLLILT